MGAAWCPIGVAVGVNTASQLGSDPIGLAAHVFAGIVVLSGLGAMLGATGGRPLPSLIGASIGAVIAMMVGSVGSLPPEIQLNVGIVMGALFGATCWPWLQFTAYLATRVKGFAQV